MPPRAFATLGQPAERFLTPAARDQIRATIREAAGNEVFFLGRADAAGLVESVEDICRGNDHAVPVLRRIARGWDVAIHNHPSGDLSPSDPDVSIAAELGDMGLAFYIVSSDASRAHPVVKLFTKPAPPAPIEAGEVSAAIGPTGALARALAGYEARPEQQRMAGLVAEALSGSKVAAIEAGTGTGKSIAYLVPALLRAVRAKERVVISTATINLQEQIVRKDLPLLIEHWRAISGDATAVAPRIALMKGRSNYVCLRKAEDAEAAPPELFEDEDERESVAQLVAWSKKTTEGTKEELSAAPRPAAWEHVSVDADTCTRTGCRLYQKCFYFQARREAAAADLVVANHHLLLADLVVRRRTGFRGAAVLPPYRHLVLDEAHHLEDVASEHMGANVTSAGLKRLVGRLQPARRPDRGVLVALMRATTDDEVARWIDERAIPARRRIDERIAATFEAASALLDALGGRGGEPESPSADVGTTLRVKPEHRQTQAWRVFAAAAQELSSALDVLSSHLAKIAEKLLDKDDEDENADRMRRAASGAKVAADKGARADVGGLALEVRALAGRAEGVSSAIASFLEAEKPDPRPSQDADEFADPPGPDEHADPPHEDEAPPAKPGAAKAASPSKKKDEHVPVVRWIERRKGKFEPQVALRTAPLSVAEALAREVYPHLSSLVMTSATLAVGQRFDYFAARTGLDRLEPGRLRTLQIASPFDYAQQAILAVPTDIPEPGERGFEEACADALLEAARASHGRAFFLFTSYRALDRAHRRLEPELRRMGLCVLKQGEGTRRRVLERFRQEAPAVLFATDSFWEGVDVRGGALKLVVIARLPFKVPSEPLQEARAEAVEAQGGDPFRALAVPQAVLKLKQGFGRLVRSRADRGAILVLDRRVLTKSYGRLFLDSMPPARRVRAPMAEIVPEIRAACAGGEAVEAASARG